jgi:hypothetical protein
MMFGEVERIVHGSDQKGYEVTEYRPVIERQRDARIPTVATTRSDMSTSLCRSRIISPAAGAALALPSLGLAALGVIQRQRDAGIPTLSQPPLTGPAITTAELPEGLASGPGDEAGPSEEIGARVLVGGGGHAPLGHVDQAAIPEIPQVGHEGLETGAAALPGARAKDPLTRFDALENVGVPLIHRHKITVGRMGRDQPGGTSRENENSKSLPSCSGTQVRKPAETSGRLDLVALPGGPRKRAEPRDLLLSGWALSAR